MQLHSAHLQEHRDVIWAYNLETEKSARLSTPFWDKDILEQRKISI